MAGLILRRFDEADEAQARQAHTELIADDFLFLLEEYDPAEPWSAYLARLDDRARGANLPAGRVPAELLAAEVDGVLVGRTSIRHELNDWLARYGGHIGYGVRPAYRRRGYATAILRASLTRAATLGIDRALVVCDDRNIGSATVIERCGGVLADRIPGPDGTTTERRYWVRTPAYDGAVPAATDAP